MLQQASLLTQHENLLKKGGFTVNEASAASGSGGPVHPWQHTGRGLYRPLRRPCMTEHQLHTHRQNAIGTTEQLVTGGGGSEGHGGGQSATAGRMCAEAPTMTQDPAQPPEVGHLPLISLHIHDHVGEACMNQRVTEHVHVGEGMRPAWIVSIRPRECQLFQSIRPEGTEQQQPARSQRAKTLRQRISDRGEPGYRQTCNDEIQGARRQRQALGFGCDVTVL